MTALAVVVGGCGGEAEQVKAPAADANVVAEVGDKQISVGDLENELNRLRSRGRSAVDRAAVLEDMIAREAMIQRAVNIGLAEDVEVRRELDNLLIAKLWEQEFESDVEAFTISEDELRAEYQRRLKAEFTRPAKVRLAMLMLNATSQMSESKKTELRDKLTEARKLVLADPVPGGRGPATLGFGKVAINYSEDQVSRYRGGDIGWFMDGNLEHHIPSEVLTVGYALQAAEISDVIETSTGYYLITKTDSRPAEVVSFEKAVPVLKQSLLVNKKQAMRTDFLNEARNMAGVTIHSSLLDRVLLPEPEVKVVSREPGFGNSGVPGIRVEEK